MTLTCPYDLASDSERRDALADEVWLLVVLPVGDDLLVCGRFGEHAAWSGVAVGRAGCQAVGVDDLGSRGEVDVGGVAEPNPVPGA